MSSGPSNEGHANQGHPGNQSSNMLITTMDSDAMEGYTISQPYSQRRAGAEKWHITRQAKRGEKE